MSEPLSAESLEAIRQRQRSRMSYRELGHMEPSPCEIDCATLLAEVARQGKWIKTLEVMLPPLHNKIAELKSEVARQQQEIAQLHARMSVFVIYKFTAADGKE